MRRNPIPTGKFGPISPKNEELVEKGPKKVNAAIKEDQMYTVKGFGDNPGEELIDLTTIKSSIERLEPYSNVPIKDLKGEALQTFSGIVNIITVAYNTAAYSMILNMVKEIFATKLNENNATPGTVAAYFVGCHLRNNFSDKACSAACAGSVPLDSSTPGWKSCQTLTFLYNPDTHHFTRLKDSENRENAYIFINNPTGSTTPIFKKFNANEVDELKKYGISNVKIVRYSPNGVDYTEETSGFVPLGQLAEPASATPNTPPSSASSSGGIDATLFIILAAILVVAIIFIGYQVLKKE